MIPLDITLARPVKELFERCLRQDLSQPERREGWRYVANFHHYASDYSPLTEVGVEIVNPREVGYSKERDGNCDWFVSVLLKAPCPIPNYLLSKEVEPQNGCLTVYSASSNGFLVRTHHGIFEDGKIISKWGNGPIFRHNIHSVAEFIDGSKVMNCIKFYKLI